MWNHQAVRRISSSFWVMSFSRTTSQEVLLHSDDPKVLICSASLLETGRSRLAWRLEVMYVLWLPLSIIALAMTVCDGETGLIILTLAVWRSTEVCVPTYMELVLSVEVADGCDELSDLGA